MKDASAQPRKIGRPLSFDRSKVLQKAMLTFWRSGYETTSITDLTTAMGVTAPSLYAAFGDKKQLFLEAMHLYAGSSVDLETAFNDAPTARDAVHQMLLASAKAFTGDATPRGCLLASATASGSSAIADVQAAVSTIRKDIEACLCRRIKQDVTKHRLPKDTDSASLAALVIAVIQGMSVLARDGCSRKKLIEIANTAMRVWPL